VTKASAVKEIASTNKILAPLQGVNANGPDRNGSDKLRAQKLEGKSQVAGTIGFLKSKMQSASKANERAEAKETVDQQVQKQQAVQENKVVAEKLKRAEAATPQVNATRSNAAAASLL